MITSRERVIKALKHEKVDRPPRDLWALPGISMFRQQELDEVLSLYPMDFINPPVKYGKGEKEKGTPSEIGDYVDSFGSVWHVGERGVIGEVKDFPIKDWSDLDKYKLPWEVLRGADFSKVNEFCARTDKFVSTWPSASGSVSVNSGFNLFERMQFLRGTENLFIDLAYGKKEVYLLRDMLHDFFMKEMKLWLKTDIDAVAWADDWGAQDALLISPDMWKDIFKPHYKDYVDLIHSYGKFAFMHSDGHIEAIYPDLVEIGVDAINSQLFCMDLNKLSQYKGKITFWGEIDRQWILPFGKPQEVREAVRKVRNALDDDNGGVIAECEWGLNVPKENIIAVYDEWEKTR